jgi:predicted nucleic acid-binding protein
MLGPVTLDVSVLIRSATPEEPGHEECDEALLLLGRKGVPLILPTLIMVELAGALSHRGQEKNTIDRVLDRVRILPASMLVPLDETLAEEAAEIAMETRLRGAAAVYVATARRAGATLLTADEEQRCRVPRDVAAVLPSEFLARIEQG